MWREPKGRGCPILAGSSLGFFCFKSVLQRSVFSSLPQKTDPLSQHCPLAPLQGQVPHRVLQCSPHFPILPPDPGTPCCGSLEPAEARAGAGGQGAVRPRGHHAWASARPSCTSCAGQVSRLPHPCQTPQPFHDTICSPVTEPTSFILSCTCNFPPRHASSSQMPHSFAGAALAPGQNVVETKWLKNF